MQKLIIGLAPNITIEIADDNVKKVIERASFWSSLPDICPLCKTPLVFFHRTPQDNEYFGQACTGPITHESNFGIYKSPKDGLYYKGEWQEAFGAYQNNSARGQGEQQQERPPQNSNPAPAQNGGDPIARTLGDMVTGKQLGMIRALCRDIKLDADNECTAFLSCRVDELSKRAASDFIEHLQGIQKSGVLPMRVAAAAGPGPAPGNGPAPGPATGPGGPVHGPNCNCDGCSIPF